MIPLNSRSLLLLAAALLTAGSTAAPGATLQFTLANLAPADSLGIEPVLFLVNFQDLTDVIHTSSTSSSTTSSSPGMEQLPQLTWQLSADAASSPFPETGGSASLPFLQPGDSVSFTLNNVDLRTENTLRFGANLFGMAPIANAGGLFSGTSLILTAGSLAAFDTPVSGTSRLIQPGAGFSLH